MIAEYLPPLYVAAIYASSRLAAMRGNERQGLVIDALALNWLLCELANLAIDYPRVVGAYITVDVASALWIYSVKGRVAGIAQAFYVGMILWNAAFFFMQQFTPMTHWTGLSVLSWAQLAFVVTGVARHDIAKLLSGLGARVGLQRHLGIGEKKTEK